MEEQNNPIGRDDPQEGMPAMPTPQQWEQIPPEPDPNLEPGDLPEELPKQRHLAIKVGAIVLAALVLFAAMAGTGYYLMGREETPANAEADTAPKPETPTAAPKEETAQAPALEVTPTPKGDAPAATVPSGELSTEEIAALVKPVVVGIEVTFPQDESYTTHSSGSGIVMREEGYIITNAHVVLDEYTSEASGKLAVTLDDGTSIPATFIGADIKTDLAVLKTDQPLKPVANFGDSDEIQVGERVVAIGNPTGQVLASSVTQGIISGVNRAVPVNAAGETMTLLQTDAAINPGNSGGALVNKYGQVIGVVSSKVAQVAYEGIGFAIPMSTVKTVVDDILKNGYVTGRVRIGITYRAIDEGFAKQMGIPAGLRVVGISDDSDAYGVLQKGDIILTMDGVETKAGTEVAKLLKEKQEGDSVTLTIYRMEGDKGKEMTVVVQLTEDKSSAVNGTD